MPQKQHYKLAESAILILDHSAQEKLTQKKKTAEVQFLWLATILVPILWLMSPIISTRTKGLNNTCLKCIITNYNLLL